MVQVFEGYRAGTDRMGSGDHRVQPGPKDHQDLQDHQDHPGPGDLMEHKDLWVLPVHKDFKDQQGPWVLMALKAHRDPPALRAQEDHMVTMRLSREGLDQGE